MEDLVDADEGLEPSSWDSQVFDSIYKSAEQGNPLSQFRLALMFSGEFGAVAPNYAKQAEWYQKASDQNHWPSMNNLACLYEDGRGVAQSHEMAFILFKKAAENGHTMSQRNLARFYESGLSVPKDLNTAFKWYEAASQGDDSVSQYKCGVFYFSGIGCTQDQQKAFELFKKSANQGHVQAKYSVGFCLQNGLGVEISNDFFEWYQKAAEANHASANFQLSKCYEEGLSVDIDIGKSEHYLKTAAELGHPEAKYQLYLKLTNNGEKQSIGSVACKLLEDSAKRGFKEARHTLARALLQGNGFQKDVNRAIDLVEKLLDDGYSDVYLLASIIKKQRSVEEKDVLLFKFAKKAADLFNQYAAFDVANMYEAGVGVQVNFEDAHRYYSRASALGHSPAVLELARCYQFGIGCNRNLRQAILIHYHAAFRIEWSSLQYRAVGKLAEAFSQGAEVLKSYVFAYALSNFAAAGGDESAVLLRDSLEKLMSPEQVGKAQELSSEWGTIEEIKNHKFFPEWITSKPDFMKLKEEAKARESQDRKRRIQQGEGVLKVLRSIDWGKIDQKPK